RWRLPLPRRSRPRPLPRRSPPPLPLLRPDPLDRHPDQFDGGDRLFVLHRDARDLLDNVHSLDYLAEDRVFSVPLRGNVRGDEELAAARIGVAAVGHGETTGAVEAETRQELVADFEAAIVRAEAGGVARLNDVARNDAM